MASEEGSIISKRFKRFFRSPNLGGMSVADPDLLIRGGPGHPDCEIRGEPTPTPQPPRTPPLDLPLVGGGSRPSDKGGGGVIQTLR